MSRTGGGRKRKASGRGRPAGDETGGAGGPDAAATELAKLAQRHKFEVLDHLLAMACLEADEQLRVRSRRKLS